MTALKLIFGKKFETNQKPILRFPRFLNFMEATKVTCSSLSMLNELKFTGIDIFIILSTNLSANFIACWSFWDASFYRFDKILPEKNKQWKWGKLGKMNGPEHYWTSSSNCASASLTQGQKIQRTEEFDRGLIFKSDSQRTRFPTCFITKFTVVQYDCYIMTMIIDYLDRCMLRTCYLTARLEF